MTFAIVISLIGLTITVMTLVWKLSAHTTKVDVYIGQLRKERSAVRRVPMLEYRIGAVEKHLDLSVPEWIDTAEEHDAE